MVDQWKTQMERNLSIILPGLTEAQRRWSAVRREDDDHREAKNLLDQASENINLVRYGKGVHNIKYAINLLEQSNSMIEQAMKLIGSSFKPVRLSVSQASLKSECYNCHPDVEQKKKNVFSSLFDHGIHLQKANLECQRCHSNLKVHGELIISKAECANCHHQGDKLDCNKCHDSGPPEVIKYKSVDFLHTAHTQTPGMSCSDCHQRKDGQIKLSADLDCYSCHHPLEGKNCGDCHQIQTRILSGEGVLNYSPTPGVMSSLGCKDCHGEPQPGKTKEEVEKSCIGCHDPSYSDTVSQWQKGINAQITSLEVKIERRQKSLLDLKDKKGNAEKEASLKSALDFSITRINLVKQDGSRGGHNYLLITRMLEEARSKLDETENQNR
jgi:hypothetical protein